METYIYIIKQPDGSVYCAANTEKHAKDIIEQDKEIYPGLTYHATLLYSPVNVNVDMAIEMNRLVHNICKNVPHDIGLKLAEIVAKYTK